MTGGWCRRRSQIRYRSRNSLSAPASGCKNGSMTMRIPRRPAKPPSNPARVSLSVFVPLQNASPSAAIRPLPDTEIAPENVQMPVTPWPPRTNQIVSFNGALLRVKGGRPRQEPPRNLSRPGRPCRGVGSASSGSSFNGEHIDCPSLPPLARAGGSTLKLTWGRATRLSASRLKSRYLPLRGWP